MDLAESSNALAPSHPIRWWEVILVPLASVVVWIGIMVVAAVVAAYTGMALGFSPETVRDFATRTKDDPALVWLVLAGFYFAVLIVLGFAVRGRGANLVATFSREIDRRQVTRAIVVGILLAVGVMAALQYLETHKIVQFTPTPSDRVLVARSAKELFLLLPLVGLLAPFVEEMYFRSFLLTWLQQKLPAFLAALLSAGIFAIAHAHPVIHPGTQGWVLTAVIAIVGLINAIWAQRSGSLWPPVALHASYNSVFVLGAFAFNG